MMTALPGLSVEIVSPPAEPEPLRSDVAGFIGATRRGPVGEAVRVVSLTSYQSRFGGLDTRASTSYAVRGYFENGGEVAWVLRVGTGGQPAWASWDVSGLTGFPLTPYRVEATSPGAWADGGRVQIWYRASSLQRQPEVDVRVSIPSEPVEVFARVPVAELVERLADSLLIRIVPDPNASMPAPAQPRATDFKDLVLAGGGEPTADLGTYRDAIEALAEQPEVAIVAAPDLTCHLQAADREEAVAALLDTAARGLDRLVVLDVPCDRQHAEQTAAWAEQALPRDPASRRAGAVYHPWLRVADPLGGSARPLRSTPPSGHVAGVISRLDRERGPHHTPANAVVLDAVDLDETLDEAGQLAVFQAGVNLLRCTTGRGLQVWGGRTLDSSDQGRFVAHRRLLHRLVRAIHRITDPLVFETNGPELRLSVVRAVTSVLLEAFRAGALRGSRPQEGFRVVCDSNNPPEQDPGLLVCEIEIAPAVPMEFIRLRLLLGQEGRLEVVEA